MYVILTVKHIYGLNSSVFQGFSYLIVKINTIWNRYILRSVNCLSCLQVVTHNIMKILNWNFDFCYICIWWGSGYYL